MSTNNHKTIINANIKHPVLKIHANKNIKIVTESNTSNNNNNNNK